MRELDYRVKYEARSVGIRRKRFRSGFFASAVCNTRLRERSVNRVLGVIEAWFNDLATISLNAYLTPNLAEFRRKITHNLWAAIFKFKLPFAI